MNPFRKSRPNPKRDEPRRVRDRERLHGAERSAERARVFRRSGGRCEIEKDGERCSNRFTLETMHWSHKRHGCWKDDRETLASCESCHREFHAGGKPVARKPGRVMSKAEAQAYLQQTKCFCDGEKKSGLPFCETCVSRLSSQLRLDLEELTNHEWLRAVADCEIELLARGQQGEKVRG